MHAQLRSASTILPHLLVPTAAADSLPVQIHWFSIINSCVTVLLLTGFLTTILLRVLKNDFLKYTSRDDEAGEAEDETGWKYLHGDVFRWAPCAGCCCV
jgi:hypothetical protein